MAARASRVTIGTTPVEITGTESRLTRDRSQSIAILPVADIWLGGSDVTTQTGFRVPAGQSFSADTTDSIWAVAAAETTAELLVLGAG